MKKRPNRTIEIIIASDPLGGSNTPEQNREYALAVRRCVADEFPRYSIAVSLTRRISATQVHVAGESKIFRSPAAAEAFLATYSGHQWIAAASALRECLEH